MCIKELILFLTTVIQNITPMKFKIILFSFLGILLTTACIREEALNAECDILNAYMDSELLIGNPIIENDRITFPVKPGIDLTALAPEFDITPGASITPASGSVHDFTTPQYYTLTSEDGQWQKQYEVQALTQELKERYSFEHYESKSASVYLYHVFYEMNNDSDKNYLWATGNQGYSITNTGKPADTYPTYSSENGLIGRSVTMVTRTTGYLGNMMGMPIAAGNLFIGLFDASAASSAATALKATRFGKPFTKVPLRLKGWYKYTPGEVFTDEKKNPVDRTDEFDIYAVFYEPTTEMPYLTGDNVLTDESIIALARISDRSPKSDFTQFEIPFVYRPGKVIDPDKLANFKYNLAIVCSSSIDGAYFRGAVGSTLIIDEFELICEQQEQK